MPAGRCKFFADCFNEDLVAASIRVRDCEVRAAAQTSPTRIRALKTAHSKHEEIARLNPGVLFETYQRALEIWDKSATVTLGSYNRTEEEWTWHREAARRLDIDTPFDLNDDTELDPQPPEHQQGTAENPHRGRRQRRAGPPGRRRGVASGRIQRPATHSSAGRRSRGS